MKKVITVVVKNYSGQIRISHECDGPLKDWIRTDGKLKDKLSRAIADALITTEAGGIMFVSQEWSI